MLLFSILPFSRSFNPKGLSVNYRYMMISIRSRSGVVFEDGLPADGRHWGGNHRTFPLQSKGIRENTLELLRCNKALGSIRLRLHRTEPGLSFRK